MRVLSSWREHQHTRALKVSLLLITITTPTILLTVVIHMQLYGQSFTPYILYYTLTIRTGPICPRPLLLPASEDAALPTELRVRIV